jgi:16S rRNA (guanine527-N7)-methyltransferase
MQPARITELLQPFLNPCHSESSRRLGEEPAVLSPVILSQSQLESISTYIDVLLRWNARINLTAICSEEEIVTRHFGESLFAARHLFPSGSEDRKESGATDRSVADFSKPLRLADLGSGAGFPGIPIKLWVPQVHLTLIESNHKKATFLREVVRSLTLMDIAIENTRAESLIGRMFDIVTLRAVEQFETILPTAAKLVAPQGRLALLIGSSQLTQAQAALPAFTWSKPEPIPASHSAILAIACNSTGNESTL